MAKSYTPPTNLPVDPSVDTKTSPVRQVAGMDACAFFGTMASMMKYNAALPAAGRSHGGATGGDRD